MLQLEGLKSIKKIIWDNLKPGMTVLGGVQVDGGLPVELLNYPVLTRSLIKDPIQLLTVMLKQNRMILSRMFLMMKSSGKKGRAI